MDETGAFKCEHCGASFSSQSDLNWHLRVTKGNLSVKARWRKGKRIHMRSSHLKYEGIAEILEIFRDTHHNNCYRFRLEDGRELTKLERVLLLYSRQ